MKRALILGIESTFDESGAAVIDAVSGRLYGASLASAYTRKYASVFGGVVPNLAAAEQDVWLNRVIASAMVRANVTDFGELAAVAVAVGPGLAGCLRQGVRRASFLSRAFRLPIVRVNHLEAHLLSPRLEPRVPELTFPFLALLASGGHTQLVVCRGIGDYEFLGGTIDDAVGEAYDKVARSLGVLGGGAAIERLASVGDPSLLPFSVPLSRKRNCLFSFTGLKTAVQRAIDIAEPPESSYWKLSRSSMISSLVATQQQSNAESFASEESLEVLSLEKELPPPLSESHHVLANPQQLFATRAPRPMAPEQLASDVAASFQQAVLRHLMSRVNIALDWCRDNCPDVNTVVLSGGVARNRALIAELEALTAERNIRTVVPPPELCTDNGVMIAWAGVEMMRAGLVDPPLDANADDIFYQTSMPLHRNRQQQQFSDTTRSIQKLIDNKY
jgi:glycoprotease/Kae1 family metallohydrolase